MADHWQKKGRHWWLTDLTKPPVTIKVNARALPGYWQPAGYQAKGLSGVMLTANPAAAAPEVRIPLPASGRYSIALGLVENYCDRVLIKLDGQRTFDRITHGDVVTPEPNCLQEVWYRDADLKRGDVLIFKQDEVMARRCAVAYVHLYPARPASAATIPLIAMADGFPGNNGVVSFDQMLADELQFEHTQVSDICHGSDLCGQAQYTTNQPSHHYPAEERAQEVSLSQEYYPWVLQQLLNYERAGRCLLRDSIGAAHSIGRKIYAYHRMGIIRVYAPLHMFGNPMYDSHPEWRCTDWDGTPICRLSIAFPEVRQHLLEHFRETVEFGADGVCLVFARGWPLLLFEKPVAEAYRRRTGRSMKRAQPDDPDVLGVRIEIFNAFMEEVHRTVTAAGKGRDVQVVALPLATPAINRYYAMDCAAWARNGWVQTFCPYPYGPTAQRTHIDVPAWVRALKGTSTRLCPIINRGLAHTPLAMVDFAEKFLAKGADGLSVWDWDTNMIGPAYRLFAHDLGTAAGRRRLRKLFKGDWPKRYPLQTFDGVAVDRFHPGWVL